MIRPPSSAWYAMSFSVGDTDTNLTPVRTVSKAGFRTPGSNRSATDAPQSWATAEWSFCQSTRIGIARIEGHGRHRIRPRARTRRALQDGHLAGVAGREQQPLAIGTPQRVADRLPLDPGELLPVSQVVDPEFGPLGGLHHRRHPAAIAAPVVALEIRHLHWERLRHPAGVEAHQPADRGVHPRGVDQVPVGREVVLALADGLPPDAGRQRHRPLDQLSGRVVPGGEEAPVGRRDRPGSAGPPPGTQCPRAGPPGSHPVWSGGWRNARRTPDRSTARSDCRSRRADSARASTSPGRSVRSDGCGVFPPSGSSQVRRLPSRSTTSSSVARQPLDRHHGLAVQQPTGLPAIDRDHHDPAADLEGDPGTVRRDPRRGGAASPEDRTRGRVPEAPIPEAGGIAVARGVHRELATQGEGEVSGGDAVTGTGSRRGEGHGGAVGKHRIVDRGPGDRRATGAPHRKGDECQDDQCQGRVRVRSGGSEAGRLGPSPLVPPGRRAAGAVPGERRGELRRASRSGRPAASPAR